MRIKTVGDVVAVLGLIIFGIFFIILSAALFAEGGDYWWLGSVASGLLGVFSIGIVVHSMALGSPIWGLPPENVPYNVLGSTIFITKQGEIYKDLLLSEVIDMKTNDLKYSEPHVFYRISSDCFINKLDAGDIIRNIHGKIEIVLPSLPNF